MTKEEKRDRILESAYQLFLTKGLTETKMIDIANAAGVGKGTIYEYFTSKDDLFEQLFEQKVVSLYRGLECALEEKDTAKEKLLAFVSFESSLGPDAQAGRHVLNNMMADCAREACSPAMRCVKNLMDYRFQLLKNVIEAGVKSGEFHVTDSLMASAAVLGAISICLTFKSNIFENHPMSEYCWEISSDTTFLTDLLLNGLNGICA